MVFKKIEKQRLLFNAGRKNDPAGMEELLKEGADIISRRHNRRSSDCSRSLSSLINVRNKDGLTLPMELAYCLTPEVLECFIRNGGDTAARDEYGAQALMHFALRNHATSSPETIREIIRLFTESGVDVNARDFDGKTALIHCIIGNHKKELVRALMEAGADINAGDRKGWTPVMYAVQFEDCWIKDGFLEFLVRDCGADINARDHNGWTPLIHAAHRNRLIPNLFDQLIALGADPYIKSLKTGSSGREEGFASSIESASLLYFLYAHITGLGDRKLQEAVFIEFRAAHSREFIRGSSGTVLVLLYLPEYNYFSRRIHYAVRHIKSPERSFAYVSVVQIPHIPKQSSGRTDNKDLRMRALGVQPLPGQPCKAVQVLR